MAEICCVSESESPAPPCESNTRDARRRRMEIRRVKFVADEQNVVKRQKLENCCTTSVLRECDNAGENVVTEQFDMKVDEFPKYGHASVCGRRRDMEDAVAIHPWFCRKEEGKYSSELHYYGVYDGHGCSHVC